MEEHAPNINNIDILPPEVHQLPKLSEYKESNQYTMDPGEEYEYHNYDEEDCGCCSDI